MHFILRMIFFVGFVQDRRELSTHSSVEFGRHMICNGDGYIYYTPRLTVDEC